MNPSLKNQKPMEMNSMSRSAQTDVNASPRSGCSAGDAGSSKVLPAYRTATEQLCSGGIKAGMDMLKLATLRWKRSGSIARQMSSPPGGQHSCKNSPLDQLAALLVSGQSRLMGQLGQEPHHQDASGKQRTCRRIVVLGAPRVGKTSILRRYLRDGFVEEYKPTSEDFHRKLFRIRGETYQIDILDASGERSFPAKRRLSILTGDVFLLVFSLDDRSSFEEVCALRTEILEAKAKLKISVPGRCAQVPFVVCANKMDLPQSERAVQHADLVQALGKDCAYFETSAKESTNLEKVFEALAKQGGLPAETGPSQHRKVSLRSYQAMCAERAQGRRSPATRCEDACGALHPLARRPSFTTDLRQLMGPQPSQNTCKNVEKCKIQ